MPGGPSRTARIAWITAAVLAVFVGLIASGPSTVGVAFFFCLPVGLAAWWFGPRPALILAVVCLALFVVASAVHPRPEFALAIVVRGVFFFAVAVAVVGDVVGHGPVAARLATFIRARFAAFAANTSDPAELLGLVNTALADRPGRREELVSAVCLRLRAGESRVAWARAGHPPPLRLPELEELPLDGTTFLLGADRRLELHNQECSLGDGEGLVVYSDGATDVRQGRQMLGLEGLRALLAPLQGLGSKVIVDEVERAILAWADRPIRDDLCLLVLKPDAG